MRAGGLRAGGGGRVAGGMRAGGRVAGGLGQAGGLRTAGAACVKAMRLALVPERVVNSPIGASPPALCTQG